MSTIYRAAPRRQLVASFLLGPCFLALAIALIVLVAVLGYVVLQSASSLTLEFLTNTPRPVGETGAALPMPSSGP